MDRRLREIKNTLNHMVEKESIKLFRLARNAKAHGVSDSTVRAIREEGYDMRTTMNDDPERVLDWRFEYQYKYAFKY